MNKLKTNHNHKLISWILVLLVTSVSGFLSVDAFGSMTTSLYHFGFLATNLILPTVLLLAILNYRWNITLFSWFTKFVLYILTPILALTTVILTLVDFHTPLNYVFSTTHLHQEQLGIITLFFYISSVSFTISYMVAQSL